MKYFKFLLCSWFFLMLFGCSTLSGKTVEEIVEKRAQARLDALLKHDVAGAWKYTSPTYRQRVTPEAYTASVAGLVNWSAAKVDTVVCSEERCEVRYLLTYTIPKMKMENTRPMNEIWIKTDGNWWIYHSR